MTFHGEFPKTKEVRDLYWILSSPGLLNSESSVFLGRIVKDQWFQEKAAEAREWFKLCDQKPAALLEDLKNRNIAVTVVGRYFEALLSFWIREYLKPESFYGGIPVQEYEPSKPGQGRNTIGEFDFLFRLAEKGVAAPQTYHWEAAVKFYIFAGDTIDQARKANHYFGTFLRDRLDIKIEKIFGHQLKLSEKLDGQHVLAHLGIQSPQVQAWVKGMLFYPLRKDWRHHPHPIEVSPHHLRGWWTEASDLDLPTENPDARWIHLPKYRWLSPAVVDPKKDGTEGLFKFHEMKDWCQKHFSEHLSPLMMAELRWNSSAQVWHEVNRGLIVYSGWSSAARDVLSSEGLAGV